MPDRLEEGVPFSSRRGIAPLLWVMLGLSSIELLVVHGLVALLWSPRAAALLRLISLCGIVWLVAAIRSLDARPVLVGPDRVRLRAGRLAAIDVARSDVAAVREVFAGVELKARDTLNLGVIAYPNVIVDQVRPVATRRRVVARVALRLDDPAGFVAALSPSTGRR